MTKFNTPSHYVLSDGSDSMDALAKILGFDEFKGFLRGNAIKYLIRYKQKGGIEDLKKARDYINRLIAIVEKTDENDLRSVAEVAEAFRKILGDKIEEEKTIAEKLYDACKKHKLLLNVDYKWEKMRNGDPVPMSTELTIAYDYEVFFAVRLDKEKTWRFIYESLERMPRPIAEELMEICTAYGSTLVKDRGDLFGFFN
ncbi:DUF3310 domain-containing protein [Aedoeadaptatus coxii]|uniref:DUF3310 domain-containing protein n=1 Tax=Aedoeadaptatus coxii TaxID=755172 RepID=UPI002AD4A576|nr:DUF3310 domain-containing protein [Peptoniphilus coxii]